MWWSHLVGKGGGNKDVFFLGLGFRIEVLRDTWTLIC